MSYMLLLGKNNKRKARKQLKLMPTSYRKCRKNMKEFFHSLVWCLQAWNKYDEKRPSSSKATGRLEFFHFHCIRFFYIFHFEVRNCKFLLLPLFCHLFSIAFGFPAATSQQRKHCFFVCLQLRVVYILYCVVYFSRSISTTQHPPKEMKQNMNRKKWT